MEGKPTVDPRFPGTFDELMDIWKREVPQNGKLIEGCYELLYRSDCIAIGVLKDSEAGSKLDGEKDKLKRIFNLLVGFEGDVIVKVFRDKDHLYDAIADAVRRRNEKLLREHDTTKAAKEIFNGRITEIGVEVLNRLF